MSHPLDRSLIFTALLEHKEFGALPVELSTLIVDDVAAMHVDEMGTNTWDTVQEFVRRITPSDGVTGYFERYAEGLAIQLRIARDRALSGTQTPADAHRLARHLRSV